MIDTQVFYEKPPSVIAFQVPKQPSTLSPFTPDAYPDWIVGMLNSSVIGAVPVKDGDWTWVVEGKTVKPGEWIVRTDGAMWPVTILNDYAMKQKYWAVEESTNG